MTETSSSRPDSSDPDGTLRPPTFVQIRPPVAPGVARLRVGIICVGLSLAAALGLGWVWSAYSPDAEPNASLPAQAALPASETPGQQAQPRDLYPEFTRLATDAAVATPPWTRESLMERVAPFNPTVADSSRPADAPPADSRSEMPPGAYEVSARLGKGETIGGALQKRGIAADTIAEVVSALARHVSLRRLPVGLGLVLQIRPAEEQGARPILQALTLQPEGHKEITVERDDAGNYLVASHDRPTRW